MRILNLEDDPRDTGLIHARLREEGIACEMTRVETEKEFRAALERGGFDLLLVDYRLPAFDGGMALAIARDACPDVPFIFVSGSMGEDIAIEALKNGAADYVLKDRLSRLAPAVRRALRESELLAAQGRAEAALRESEEHYRTLNRTLRAKSDSSYALLRARDELSYLQEVCRIIVEDCGHALVWIGYAQDDEGKTVRPVAHAGFEKGYLESLKITWADRDRGRGPVGTAIRTGATSVFRSALSDPRFAPWREEARKRGYAAVISLPLLAEGRAFGALSIYSSDDDAFSGDETGLLTDLAADLAYGVTALRQRAAQETAEAALRTSEKRFRSLFENMLEGFAYCRMLYEQGRPRDFIYLEVNGAFEKLTGLKDVVGKRVSAVIPGILESNPELLDIYGRVAMTGSSERFDTFSPHFGGWLSITVYSTEQGYFIAVFDNITERKKLEAQLRHAQKMEAIGRLAGGVAHDFNNILNVIMGYGDIAYQAMDEAHPARAPLQEVLAAAERAAKLTGQLLAFSRKQVADLKPVRVNGIVAGVERMLSRIIGEDIELVVRSSDRDEPIVADASLIEQVLMNLATNARDAMPHGGTFTISTGPEEIDDGFIAMHGYGKPGRYVQLSVEDSGVGMDADTLQRIFEPFYTTKGVGEGTGLGLSIVYGIVKQHNGFIQVYSEPGKGTTFSILLPLAEGSAVSGPAVEPATELKGGTETILVAEDDEPLRKMIKTVLEAFGYAVVPAEDGEAAVARFRENKERVDLVILDVIMPKKSGKDAYGEITAIKPGIKALFTSGYTLDMIKRKEIEEGLELLHKPYPAKGLLKKVREILDR